MKKKLHDLSSLTLIITGVSVFYPSRAFPAETEYLIGSSLKMIWGLLVVLGILLIIYGLARKKLTFIQGGGKGAIKVLETKHLMPKKTLFLVEVAGNQYLLGAGAESLTMLTHIEPKEPPPSFNDILNQSKEEPAL